MDKIEKLLRKVSRHDRERLLVLIKSLMSEKRSSHIRKIIGTDFFRLRSGRFRIIFHYERSEIIIDAIKLKNKDTYKGL